MATKIKIKQTSIAGRTPSNDPNNTAYIEQGELALNTADHKLFSKDSNGDVFVIGGGAGGGGASGLEEWKWKWKKWETGYSEPMGSDPEAWTTWFKEKTNSAVTPDLEGFLDTKSAVNAQGTFGGDVGNMFPAGIDSYTAHIHTFIYVNQEFSISSTLKGDSTFALFIDEVFVDGSTLSFEDVAYSHTLTKGWHAIDLIYSVSGRGMGDYVQLGWNPQDYSQITAMTPTYATGSVNLPLTGGTLSGDLDVSGHISASSLTLGNYEQIYWSPTTLMYGHATNGISLITQGATRLKIQDNGNIEMDSNLDVAGNVTVDGTVDGRDVATDGTKLDGIASNAQVNTTSEPISYITGLQTALNQKASITYVDAEVSALVNSAPATLNTLKELSDALGNDDNHATTMTNLVGTKLSLSGGVMSGDLNMATNEIYLGTNSKLRIGNGQDLEIYHDGNDSHITDRGKGLLFIRGSVGVRIQGANGENGITLNENASVDLYHNNSRKLSTTSSGIDVTGTVAATSFTSTGNVGIGTTNPSHNLSVAGTLGISEVNATGSRLKIFTSSAGAYFNQHDNSNIYFQQIGQTKLTIEYPTGELLFANDTEHRIGKLTTGISGVVETTRIMGRNIDLYAYDDVNIRAGSGDKITMHTGSGHTERMRITSTGNVEMSGNLKLSTVPSTTANAFVPILFQPTEGTISGDSALTWNPAQDALNINGTHITSNYIRSSGTNSLKFGTASAGQIVELTSTGNVEMNGNLDVTGSVSVGSTAVIGSDAKIDANKIKNVPSSWLIGDTDTWRSISDSISSTSTTVSASSKAVKTAYDKGNHSHPYLPLSGGTITGDIKFDAAQDIIVGSTMHSLLVKNTAASSVGLVLRGSNNEHRMQLYGASNGYGFLDGPWASWDIKKVPSGIFEVDEGSGLKRVWNAGNDGSGSGLDADLLDGKHASSFALTHSHPYLPSSGKAVDADKLDGLDLHTGTNNHANKVVRTDGNGYLNVGWINTASGNMNYANNISRVYCSNDGYLRYLSAREFKVLMGLSGRTTYDRRDYTTDTNYHIGAISHGAESMDTTFHKGDGFTDNWSNPAGQPSGTSHWTGHQSLHYSNGSSAHGYQFVVGAGNPALTYIRGKWGSSGFTSWAKVWNDKNDGSGSGLDADLLDGKHASSFALTHSHPYLASSGKAVDSDKLDGIDSTSFMRSDATDYQNNTIYQRGYLVNETGYRDKGVYGNYDSHKTNMIWSMGIAYKSHSSGNTFGNLYGLAYKHTNNVNGGAMGGSHQVVWCHNGTPRGAIGYDRVWHAEGMSVGTSYNKVWHAGNDGSGSGLDADKLDGVEPSNYANANTIARRDQNGNLAAGTFNGRATSANWADLAEKYEADTEYGVGVVLGIGGDKEVTKYVSGMPLAGVVSMEPALQMNVTEETTDWPFVALKGRVPVNINGSAKKGDYIIADDDGKGIAIPEVWSLSEQNRLIGIALEDGHDTIEVKI